MKEPKITLKQAHCNSGEEHLGAGELLPQLVGFMGTRGRVQTRPDWSLCDDSGCSGLLPLELNLKSPRLETSCYSEFVHV